MIANSPGWSRVAAEPGVTLKFYRSPDVRSGRQKPQLQCVANASGTLSLRSGFGFFFVYYPAFRRCRGFMLGYWLPPTEWAQISARLRLANCRFVVDCPNYANAFLILDFECIKFRGLAPAYVSIVNSHLSIVNPPKSLYFEQ